jgi:hypothetical protein
LKTPVPLDQHPPELQPLLGYDFFKLDPETRRPRELDEIFGPGSQREFWMKIDDVAQDVCSLLRMLEAEKFGSIYLASLQKSNPSFLPLPLPMSLNRAKFCGVISSSTDIWYSRRAR